MRIRATVAAVSGALALSALAVPAAQADGSAPSYRAEVAKAFGSHGKTAFTATAPVGDLDVSFSNFKIASAIVVGTTNRVSTTVTYTLTHGADIDINSDDFDNGPIIYKGSIDAPDNVLGGDLPATCTATSSTTASCKGLIDIDPADELINSDAGTWSGAGLALTYSNDGSTVQGGLATTKLQRFSRLTVNASPEPVKKGKTVTVTGLLSRANWDTGKYAGYTVQPVGLQFRTKSSSTYTSTLKTVKSDSVGNLKTTTTATVDGYFRYNFAGTSTTPAVKATGDYVDVQ
ncbi:hypothetical protein ACIBAC_40305 [Streptomyces sp. NPDC051362]|uniref:hypothetical protein n=1 Tax=Streptomyces sp. NPDC051362 TaxID=3365651 RepID=UPI00378C6F45